MASPPLSNRMSSSAAILAIVAWGILCVIGSGQSSPDANAAGYRDYCNSEDFSPRCYEQDEVILVTAARYGLLDRSSKCVTDKTSSGTASEVCSADVIAHLSGRCSGRKSCDVKASNMTRLAGHCPPTNDMYLNASFHCVKAEYVGCSKCDDDGYARVRSSDRGRLASFVTADSEENGCGTSRCPWLIEVKPGQVINVTLVDFATVQRSSSSSPGSRLSPSWGGEAQCSQSDRYAVVKERANPKEAVVCGGGVSGGGGTRRHVYTSISNRVEVHVAARDLLDRPFFIEFQAIGCADVMPPRNTWMRRTDDHVDVGCPTTGAKWSMNCVDGQWNGDQMTGATCPGVPGVVIPGPGPLVVEKPELAPAVSEDTSSKSFIAAIPDTILIAAVVAVACIIGVLVLTTGIVCIKKHQYTKKHKPPRPSSIYTRATEEFEFHGEVNGQAAGMNPAETAPMMMMMTSMPPQGGPSSSARPGQRGGMPPQTAAKPRVPQQQGLVAGGRRYPQDLTGANGAQFAEAFDAEQRQMMMIGNRPLPSIPPNGSGDRRPGRALQQALQQFQPQQQFQTTAMMHHPYQYPMTGIPQQGGCYPHPHAECTCHGPPRGPRFVVAPGYQTQPPPLAPKVKSVGTGPTNADGWGGYGSVGGGSLNRPYSEAIYGNEGGDLPMIYRSADDQHHYFVLDPDATRDRQPPSPTMSQRMVAVAATSSNPPSMTRGGGTFESASEQRFPTPPPPLPEAVIGTPVSTGVPPSAITAEDATVSARRQSPDGKERDESRDGGGGTMDELKNVNRCSVHEIPLRPTRDGSSSGLISPSMKGVDETESAMGTNISSWP